jgi:glycosyltransferase involved in cell wall biosynthesis
MIRPGDLHLRRGDTSLSAPPLSRRRAGSRRAAIIGTVGLPARYGGFETLAEQLVRAADARGLSDRLTVWCSRRRGDPSPPGEFHGARLRHLRIPANGAASIAYDGLSALAEVLTADGADSLLLLGVSGGGPVAALRPLTTRRIVVNVDGREAGRAKWGGTARRVLAWSEARAVAAADAVVADNAALAAEIEMRHRIRPRVIAYGGDHAWTAAPAEISDLGLPPAYALCLARAEPENNLTTILEAFSGGRLGPLVAVANWSATRHGRALHARWSGMPGLHLVEAEYDPARLRAIRDRAWLYVHGHSAGGTNPALVEMMGFSVPILAWDCPYNRETTAGKAAWFRDAPGLGEAVAALAADPAGGARMGAALAGMAIARYVWDDIAEAYFDLLDL